MNSLMSNTYNDELIGSNVGVGVEIDVDVGVDTNEDGDIIETLDSTNVSKYKLTWQYNRQSYNMAIYSTI